MVKENSQPVTEKVMTPRFWAVAGVVGIGAGLIGYWLHTILNHPSKFVDVGRLDELLNVIRNIEVQKATVERELTIAVAQIARARAFDLAIRESLRQQSERIEAQRIIARDTENRLLEQQVAAETRINELENIIEQNRGVIPEEMARALEAQLEQTRRDAEVYRINFEALRKRNEEIVQESESHRDELEQRIAGMRSAIGSLEAQQAQRERELQELNRQLTAERRRLEEERRQIRDTQERFAEATELAGRINPLLFRELAERNRIYDDVTSGNLLRSGPALVELTSRRSLIPSTSIQNEYADLIRLMQLLRSE